MEKVIRGKAFVFGANVDTDQIYPGRFLELTAQEDLAKHAMEGVDPDFVKEVSSGDILVASTNFGCGSSREHAVITLKAAGVGAILAESFGRIFYRNAINLGIPVIVCPGISTNVEKGNILCVDLSTGKVLNETSGVTLQATPISDYVVTILSNGGIKPLLQNQLKCSG
ncbi:MAG TPA: 3-isopropylmalate dehydratase small subunit [Selenomonadales bacterium]|nr:3-isopropylmalate dehydratase small subunit [Selenomonadales bacterium]